MMKKLLMMAAIAVVAFCAQAGETSYYQWQVTITDVPFEILPSTGLVGYWLDGSADAIKGSKYLYDGKAVMARLEQTSLSIDRDNADKYYINYNIEYYGTDGTLKKTAKATASSIVENVGEGVKLGEITLTVGNASEQDFTWWNMGVGESMDEYAKNLSGVLLSEATSQKLDLAVTRNNSDHALGSKGTFTDVTPTPEPTSGMLVFLGLAGLMLKRKRAA